jgi:hypothetical protein
MVQIDYLEQGGGPYRPGACNIGPYEIARRRHAGLFELGLAAVIAVALVVVDAPPVARLVVFPFLAGAIVSLEQARRHFCAGFGMAGIRNFGAREDLEHIADAAAKAADRRAALVMFGYSSAIAAAITALFVVLPI